MIQNDYLITALHTGMYVSHYAYTDIIQRY